MDVCKVYIADGNFPSDYTISGEGDFLKLLYYDYHANLFGHISFVHHEYTDYWERGVPIIHVANNLKISSDGVSKFPGKFVTVFLPRSVNRDNANILLNQLDEIQNNSNGEKCYNNLIYVKEKTDFGYNYECYPPLYMTGDKIPFQKAVSIFLRDSFQESADEEIVMFDEFRKFDISKMLTETHAFSYPINHNYCAVEIVNSVGERYSSTVTKTGHQETLNYLFSCMVGRDINEEEMGLLQEVTGFSSAVFLFREGEVISYIPEKISKLQHDELINIADEIENLSPDIVTVRVFDNGDLSDEDVSFRDNVSKSYQQFLSEKKYEKSIIK